MEKKKEEEKRHVVRSIFDWDTPEEFQRELCDWLEWVEKRKKEKKKKKD